MKTIGIVFYGLAAAVIAYNLFLKYLSCRDGKFRSWVFAVATIFSLFGSVFGGGDWRAFLAIVAADWLFPFLIARYPGGGSRGLR